MSVLWSNTNSFYQPDDLSADLGWIQKDRMFFVGFYILIFILNIYVAEFSYMKISNQFKKTMDRAEK